MTDDSLAADLGEVPAKDVATIAKAASEEAIKWLKRNSIEAGAGTLAYAGTLLKVSTPLTPWPIAWPAYPSFFAGLFDGP